MQTIDEQLDHVLGFFAKLLCSGVFVVGREAEEFLRHDLHTHLRPEGMPVDWAEIEVRVDRDARRVTLAARGRERSAVFHPGQGCTIVPRGRDDVHFTPVPVVPRLPDPGGTPWPDGDLPAGDPPAVDRAALEAALARAFDDTQWPAPQHARAIVVLHDGAIVGERYAPGFGPRTRHISWSMGKSITAALVGILVGEGALALDAPAPVPEWQGADDPRRAITLRQLLNMSSGLAFMRAQDEERLELGWTSRDDHMYIYFGGIDVFEHAITRPLADPPGTAWRYRNCDPLTLGRIVRQTVEARGEEYLTFPQRALFDRIGCRDFMLEPDPWGNFILTGFDYGTARDWARFGLLHLRDGVWPASGERVLPEGWVEFVRTPAPADPEQGYGGQFWLNAGGRHPHVPRDAYWPAGAWGQFVKIVPSHDAVIVWLGHSSPLDDTRDAYVDAVVSEVLAAL